MSKICCTAFSDRRLADHFGGKLHLGYMLIRDKLAELQVIYSRIFLVIFLFSLDIDCIVIFSLSSSGGEEQSSQGTGRRKEVNFSQAFEQIVCLLP